MKTLFSLTAAVKSNCETLILSVVYHICIREVRTSTVSAESLTVVIVISLSEPTDEVLREYAARHDGT